VNRLSLFVFLAGLFGLTSCNHTTATSTAITCTTTSSTSSTSSTNTCTDPTTNISVTISPAAASVNVATAQLFAGSVSGGTNGVVVWKVNNIQSGDDTVGVIDSRGNYTAPRQVPKTNPVTIAAVSFEDQKLSATATVTVTPPPVVTITSPPPPYPVKVTSGASSANSVAFSATVTGGTNETIYWCVGTVGGSASLGGNATVGTIDGNGIYTPPLTPPIGSEVLVTAAVSQDCLSSATSVLVAISGYSASSLRGQFAFSLAGHILSGPSTGAFFRAGSFFADGAGSLSGGLEDINEVSGVTSGLSFAGSYTVSSDGHGRGTLSFNDSHAPSNLPSNFDFVLVNGNQVQITGFDSSKSPTYLGTASGQADTQITSVFSGDPLSVFNGVYVFNFAGTHGSKALSQVGEFTADGAGKIKGGSIDINDGGTSS